MLMNRALPSFGEGRSELALSGQVYGVLVNDPALLIALGDAVHSAPYKAAPRAPVLYIKPRNTQVATGATVVVDADVPGFMIGAALGLVIGRTARRLSATTALDWLAGYLLVVDLTVPHDQFYRPSVRFRIRDDSCVLGPRLAPPDSLDPDGVRFDITIDSRPAPAASTAGRLRDAAALLADVTAFMTLRRGDILLTGLVASPPVAHAGDRVVVSAPLLGAVELTLVASDASAASQGCSVDMPTAEQQSPDRPSATGPSSSLRPAGSARSPR